MSRDFSLALLWTNEHAQPCPLSRTCEKLLKPVRSFCGKNTNGDSSLLPLSYIFTSPSLHAIQNLIQTHRTKQFEIARTYCLLIWRLPHQDRAFYATHKESTPL